MINPISEIRFGIRELACDDVGAAGGDGEVAATTRDACCFPGVLHGPTDAQHAVVGDEGKDGWPRPAETGPDRSGGARGFGHRDQMGVESRAGRLVQTIAHSRGNRRNVTSQHPRDNSTCGADVEGGIGQCHMLG
jgi:hypothetical protein